MSERGSASDRASQTKSTSEADSGQGAGTPKHGEADAGGPVRRSGRIVMRHDAAQRIGKPGATEDEKFLERRSVSDRPAFVDSDPGLWEELYDINFAHILSVTHAFLPAMIERGSGRILNVASTAAFQPGPLMR